MTDAFIITRAQVLMRRPCDLELFEKSAYRVGDALVFPDGWTPAVLEEFARNRPRNLIWLARTGLIPVHIRAAMEAIHNAVAEPGRPEATRSNLARALGLVEQA